MKEIKVVVVTGGTGVLGRALVSEFVANGWQVIATGRSEHTEELPSEVEYHQFDASNAADCEAFWKQVSEKYAEAQFCLVNNAGGYVSGNLLEITPGDFEQQVRSNYFAAVYMTRGLAAVIPKARIINIISSSALAAHAKNSAYGAAKAAEMHFFQSLQEEFTPAKYQITNLYPLSIATRDSDPHAIEPSDLARFICEQADMQGTYYLKDATVYPS